VSGFVIESTCEVFPTSQVCRKNYLGAPGGFGGAGGGAICGGAQLVANMANNDVSNIKLVSFLFMVMCFFDIILISC